MSEHNLPDKFVLWIDDDGLLLGHPMENLRNAGIDCRLCQDVDLASKVIRDEEDKISIILIDVMMRPGECLIGYDTRHGFETGLRFIDYLEDQNLAKDIKKLIYTNAAVTSPYRPSRSKSLEVKVVQKGRFKGLRFPKFLQGEIGET